LFLYNIQGKIFTLIPESILGGKNPINTSFDGIVPAVFSAGRYKAEVRALGYKPVTVDFRIGPGEDETYPQVLLEPEPFNPVNLISYYLGTFIDVFDSTVSYVNDLSLSVRFFDLVAAFSLALFVITVIFSFSVRTHMRISHIPLFFLYDLEDLFGFSKERYVTGEVIDAGTGKPVSRAKIRLLDAQSGTLLFETHSNKLGDFLMRKPKAKVYKLDIEKSGYNKLLVSDYLPNALSGKLKFNLQSHEGVTRLTPARIIRNGVENLTGFFFEFLLLNSIILELIFIKTRGFAKTAPFIFITLLTIIIWLFYAKRVMRRIFARTRA
jgi:hypothetical protein